MCVQLGSASINPSANRTTRLSIASGSRSWWAAPLYSQASGVRSLRSHATCGAVRWTVVRRTILCEYHATGAATGAFLIRKGPFKYVHYVGMPPQLFDLDVDPDERHDLGRDPGYAGVVAMCEAELRAVVDPEAADRLAHADQAAKIEALGGREAILARGSFGYSPVPGTKPVYN